jgi:hypothetical protein
VPVEFLTVIASAQPLLTIYTFSIAGTIKFCAPPDVPVRFKRKLRATCVELESVSVSVTVPLEKVTSAEPTIASSRAVPKFTFVTLPHVPEFSPVAMS